MTKTPFFDEPDPKRLPKWVNDLRKRLEKGWGKPCLAFNPDCCSCRLWISWITIADLHENWIEMMKDSKKKIGKRRKP